LSLFNEQLTYLVSL